MKNIKPVWVQGARSVQNAKVKAVKGQKISLVITNTFSVRKHVLVTIGGCQVSGFLFPGESVRITRYGNGKRLRFIPGQKLKVTFSDVATIPVEMSLSISSAIPLIPIHLAIRAGLVNIGLRAVFYSFPVRKGSVTITHSMVQ